jgi:hypothetical protein
MVIFPIPQRDNSIPPFFDMKIKEFGKILIDIGRCDKLFLIQSIIPKK